MSPRPKKPRRCHCLDGRVETLYKPASVPLSELARTVLAHDEVDALMLCDGEGLTQEEAGRRMGVSRGTVQRLVSSGRKKLIEAVVRGYALVIEAE